MRLCVVAAKITDSVIDGFLPAAARLGLDVTVLTDRSWPDIGPIETVRCDVTDFREIIAAAGEPDAIFSNSDHLQTPTALAADFLGLPGKDWKAALRTKNKALMRRTLGDVHSSAPEDATRFPLVLKPREGVASEDVFLVRDRAELAARVREIRSRRSDPLVAEEYLPGELHTLETLNGQVIGAFHTRLSDPPYFIEERLDWTPPPRAHEVMAQLRKLGVGLGACHTEYVVHEDQAKIIEVNYRIIGDHCDFLIGDLLGVPIFEWVLRAHLGETVPKVPQTSRHAAIEAVVADRPGTLTAPDATRTGTLAYRPVRHTGDRIEITRTNRDYLGTIQAIGPSPEAVNSAIAEFRATHRWDIS